MSALRAVGLVIGYCILLNATQLCADDEKPAQLLKGKFTIGKDTTYVNEQQRHGM